MRKTALLNLMRIGGAGFVVGAAIYVIVFAPWGSTDATQGVFGTVTFSGSIGLAVALCSHFAWLYFRDYRGR